MRTHQPVKTSGKANREKKKMPLFNVLDDMNAIMILTFSETRLLLPLSSSGAIHGSVPRTPPETRVLRLILDNPKSPT